METLECAHAYTCMHTHTQAMCTHAQRIHIHTRACVRMLGF